MTTTTKRSRGGEKWTPNPEGRRVLHILSEEIESFEEEAQRFRNGEWDSMEFTRFRLRQGIYGQRQPDRQMVRVKVPFGGLTAHQMDALGQFSDRFAPLKKGHLTTRENVQYHHVLLSDTPEALRLIGDAGLTTREACGNTVRNVVAPPDAGVSRDEVFDVTPYAALTLVTSCGTPLPKTCPARSRPPFRDPNKTKPSPLSMTSVSWHASGRAAEASR